MASNYTSNYNLCQWQASDKVLRTEFNADNAKIDAALAGLERSKASATALSSLKSTVDSLSTAVSGHTGALAKKGNCVLYTTTYTGTGTYGSQSAAAAITFPGEPWLVVITWSYLCMVMVRGSDTAVLYTERGGQRIEVIWSGNTVSWYSPTVTNAANMANAANTSYPTVALLKADA